MQAQIELRKDIMVINKAVTMEALSNEKDTLHLKEC